MIPKNGQHVQQLSKNMFREVALLNTHIRARSHACTHARTHINKKLVVASVEGKMREPVLMH